MLKPYLRTVGVLSGATSQAGSSEAIDLTEASDDTDTAGQAIANFCEVARVSAAVGNTPPVDQEDHSTEAMDQGESIGEDDYLCEHLEVEALMRDEDIEIAEYVEDRVREEEEKERGENIDLLSPVEDDWKKRTVFDPVTETMIDKMTVTKLINKKTPLAISKSGDRERRVASVAKYSSRSDTGASTAISRAYNHGINPVDVPEGEAVLKYGDYAMMLVEALTKKGRKERKRFGVVVRLLAFGKKKNILTERWWDAENDSGLVLVEVMKLQQWKDAAGQDALKIIDEVGQHFRNVSIGNLEMLTPYSQFEGGVDCILPTRSWIFVKKDLDKAFEILVGEAQCVKVTKSVIEPIVIGDGAGYLVQIGMDPIVCDVCSMVSNNRE